MARLGFAEHVSPCCVKVTFEPEAPGAQDQMRVIPPLTDPASYEITGVAGLTIIGVELPYAQAQVYDPMMGVSNGGAPVSVYLITNIPAFGGIVAAGLTLFGTLNLLDWDGAPVVLPPATVPYIAEDFVEPSYWTAKGWKVRELYRELSGLAPRLRLTSDQPNARAVADMIGRLADLAGGGTYSVLANTIDGPPMPIYDPVFGYAGFSFPGVPDPGVGDLIQFDGGVIPCHVDKLWGPCNGVNRVFRASIPFHPFSCHVIVAPGASDSEDEGIVDPSGWYAPNNGQDRMIVLSRPPPLGAGVLAVYVPRKSLVNIGKEILAYDDSDIHLGQATIYGRQQLCSDLEEHLPNDIITDVWAGSLLTRAEFNMLAFGASGRALEHIGMDAGSPREDNPSLCDTNLRRMIFHTSCTMRGVPGTARLACRYIFPRLYRRLIVGEDPRWPGCLVIWWSGSVDISPDWATDPGVEPWETWLDHISWPDGMPFDMMYETFWRDVLDVTYDGDYLLADGFDDPEIAPYPVVVSGPDIAAIIGMPLSFIPPPSTVSMDYIRHLVRPACLDKVLPCGVGVLVLDAGLL